MVLPHLNRLLELIFEDKDEKILSFLKVLLVTYNNFFEGIFFEM